MRESLLDTELEVPPWRRGSSALRFTGAILTAGLVASLVNVGIGEAADPGPVPRWTIAVPDEFGEPLLA